MQPLSAISPYTCALACLESYFSDIGVGTTQCDILRDHPTFCSNPAKPSEFGAVTVQQLAALCQHLGFTFTPYKDHRKNLVDSLLQSLTSDSTALIYANWNLRGHHCVRFHQILPTGNYEVMNPQFQSPKIESVPFKDLVDWNFEIFVVSR